MTINQIAADAIGLFLESLDHLEVDHGLDADAIERATAMALVEVGEGTEAEQAKLDAAANAVVVTDLRAFAMDSALTDVNYALGQIERVLRRFGPVCELVRAKDGLLRAIESLTPTATVPTMDFADALEANVPPPKSPGERSVQDRLDREG